MRYFLGMKVARSKKGISISQENYVLDLLTETGMLGCKPSDNPIEAIKRTKDFGKHVEKERYQILVSKLIYLSHTRPYIAFVMSVVRQQMHSPKKTLLETVYKILKYLKGSSSKTFFSKDVKVVLVDKSRLCIRFNPIDLVFCIVYHLFWTF